MSRIFVGIDPGLSGGIAFIREGKLSTFGMPTMKHGRRNSVDVRALRNILFENRNDDQWPETDFFVVIESAQKFSAGTNALTSTWFGFGRIMALLELEGFPHEVIDSPLAWQKQFWRKPRLPKGQKFDTKEASINAATRLWPSHDFRPIGKSGRPVKTGTDGLTDAALLAEWGRRNIG